MRITRVTVITRVTEMTGVAGMTRITGIAMLTSGTAEGEGLVGPRPNHFFVPPPPLFALKRKIIKIKKKT